MTLVEVLQFAVAVQLAAGLVTMVNVVLCSGCGVGHDGGRAWR